MAARTGLFCACREQSRRAQGLAELSAKGQEATAAPEPCGRSVPELLCPPHFERWLWELGIAQPYEVCAQVPRGCQSQEKLKVHPNILMWGNSPAQPSVDWGQLLCWGDPMPG